MEKSDEDLMFAFQKEGQLRELEILWDRYANRLLSFFYRQLRDYQNAESLTQEIFYKIYRNSSQYKYPKKFSTWLFSIARNLYTDEIRKRKFVLPDEFEKMVEEKKGSALSPLESLIYQEEVDRLHQAISTLTPLLQETLEFRIYQKLSYAEIAEIIGGKESTIRSRMKYALEKLEEALKEPRPPRPPPSLP